MTIFATVADGGCHFVCEGTRYGQKEFTIERKRHGNQPSSAKTGRRITSREPASDHAAQDFSPATQTEHTSTSAGPSEHEIRLRAYHRYLDRGAFHGADFDDWLQAEMELKKR